MSCFVYQNLLRFSNQIFTFEIQFFMKKVLIVLLALIVLGVIYLRTQGLFQSVLVEQRSMPGYRVAGINHLGHFRKWNGILE